MPKRKLDYRAELKEAIAQTVDLRSTFGQSAMDLVDLYSEHNNTFGLSALRTIFYMWRGYGISGLSQPPSFELVGYEEGPVYFEGRKRRKETIGRCKLCSRKLSKVHKISMGYKDDTEVVRTGQIPSAPYFATTLGFLDCGSEHLKIKDNQSGILPIIRDLGDSGFIEKFSEDYRLKELRRRQETVDSILKGHLEIPEKLREQLKKMGLDIDLVLESPAVLEAVPDVLEGNCEMASYKIDPANKRSWFNWFREKISKGEITDPAVINTVGKLEQAAHTVEPFELAYLVAYSYQHKPEISDGLVGSLRKDIYSIYGEDCEKLEEEAEPARILRGAELKPFVVGEKIKSDTTLTRAEAIGVRYRFAGIDQLRIEKNKEAVKKYFGDYEKFDKAVEGVRLNYGKATFSRSSISRIRSLIRVLEIGDFNNWSARESLLRLLPVEDAEPIYRTLAVEHARLRIRQDLEAGRKQGSQIATSLLASYSKEGLDNVQFIPIVDLEEPLDIIEKLAACFLDERAGTKLRTFAETDAPRIATERDYGVVSAKYITGKKSRLATIGKIAGKYKPMTGLTEGDIDVLRYFIESLDFKTDSLDIDGNFVKGKSEKRRFDFWNFARAEYLTDTQAKTIAKVRGSVFSRKRVLDKDKIDELKQFCIEETSRSTVYVNDFITKIKRADFREVCSLDYITRKFLDPEKISKFAETIETAVNAKELDFLPQLAERVRTRNWSDPVWRSYGYLSPGIDQILDSMTKSENVLIAKEVVGLLEKARREMGKK